MTENEAIKNIEDIKQMYTWSTGADDALDMAIEALRKQRDERGRVTNSEELRAMTDEELAKVICGMIGYCSCSECAGYDLCDTGAGEANGLVKWLKEEVVEDDN